jgi:hypothetical protein
MRLYPEVRSLRAATFLRDVLVVVLLVLFAWIGLAVHEAVDDLAVLGEGVQDAGGAVLGGFESAADAVDDTPLIGDELAGALEGAGAGTGGNVVELGERGESSVHRLANILGLIVFGLPALLVLLWYLPRRIEQVRRLHDAGLVLGEHVDPARRRVVAMRAAFSLPYGRLLEYTRDPLGDLAAERYDPLIAAALEDAGLQVRPSG